MPSNERRNPLRDAAYKVKALQKRPEGAQLDRPTGEDGKTWDQKHKASSFRIRSQDAERLAAKAKEMGLSKDALGCALIWAALDALESGALVLEIDTVQTKVTDKRGRVRIYVKKQARPAWVSHRTPPEANRESV